MKGVITSVILFALVVAFILGVYIPIFERGKNNADTTLQRAKTNKTNLQNLYK